MLSKKEIFLTKKADIEKKINHEGTWKYEDSCKKMALSYANHHILLSYYHRNQTGMKNETQAKENWEK